MRLSLKQFFILSCIFLSILPNCTEGADQALTQRDWMINLVDTLGYNFGLSDVPQDNDYINLLEGDRNYRFEAETARNPTDLVAINDFTSYGEFSGSGWVSSLSIPTMVRLNFTLPHSGRYRLFAALRLAGHTLMLEGQTWQISEVEQNFQRIELGEINLNAGMKELVVSMPVNGSIDYIELTASPLPAISPLSGWDLHKRLSNDDLAVTTIRALELQTLLPLQGEQFQIEAETNSTQRSFVTDQRHLGEPHGGLWLRNGANTAEVTLPFKIDQGAVYTLDLIAEGTTSLAGNLDGHEPWQSSFPSYLKEQTIGTWFLADGQHEIKITLPPRGGVDLLTLTKRRSSAEDYLILAGLSTLFNVEMNDANRLLTLIARLHNQD